MGVVRIDAVISGSAKVSVIVPTHNRPEFLAEALHSVAAQTERSFECIVVDDGSAEPVRLPFADVRFRLVRSESSQGVAAARNLGIQRATGDYVAFLDDDDLWAPTRLQHALNQAKPGVVVICALGRVGSSRVDIPVLVQPLADTILNRSPPNLGAVIVARDACPEFDTRYAACEDLDWWLRLAPKVRPVVTRDAGWLWRQHDGPRGSVSAQARIDGSLHLLRHHDDYFNRHRTAAAYRWVRIGWLARASGQRSLTFRAGCRAFTAYPRLRTAARVVRMFIGK